ncbi:MAG TPA: hypothetical protein VNT03_08665 [Baekduia sp.]|nr:hypothetical protein [Baekduia sp.]
MPVGQLDEVLGLQSRLDDVAGLAQRGLQRVGGADDVEPRRDIGGREIGQGVRSGHRWASRDE